MENITATLLDQWSDRIQSRHLLPELVKKLVYALMEGLTKVDIPTGEQIQHPGWDGIVVTRNNVGGNEFFLPNGTCLIEMGTNKDTKTKANGDYAKRCNDSLGYDREKCTFVFITQRDWVNGRDWEQEKISEHKWKDVRVISATILADWLAMCPAVSSWLAGIMGLKTDFQDIEGYWKLWSENSSGQKLDLSFAISGRDDVSHHLVELLESQHELTLISQSSDESLAFTVASILKYGLLEQKSRTVISKDSITTNELLYNHTDIIILYQGERENFGSKVKERKCSIVYFSRPEEKRSSSLNEITLPEIDVNAFVKALKITLGNEIIASQYARDSGKNISILRRRLNFDGTMPEWSKPENIVDLLPALILGKWNDSVEGDKKILEKLSHKDYFSYAKELSVWLHKEDSPFTKIASSWLVKSPYDVIIAAIPYLLDSNITNDKSFMEICHEVFSDVDDSYQNDWDSKSISWHQFNTKYSDGLRKGLLCTLILLSLNSRDSKSNFEAFVDKVIRDSIKVSDVDWWLTACRGDFLSLMAEASPVSFLDKIEEDLYSNNSAIKIIFQKDFSKQSFWGWGTHFTSILFALEILALTPEYLSRASNILLRLCDFGEKKGIANNPLTSLKEILHPCFPKTFASTEQRNQVLKMLYTVSPEKTFKLCFKLINDRRIGGPISPSLTYWRTFGQSLPVMTGENFYKELKCCIDICCSKDDLTEDEYLALIKIVIDNFNPIIPIKYRSILIDKLRKSASKFKGNQKVLKSLHEADYFIFAYCENKQIKAGTWTNSLINIVQPDDIVGRELWKFDNSYKEPSIYDEDFDKMQKKKTQARQIALSKILEEKGLQGLEYLCSKAQNSYLIGLLLADYDNKIDYWDFVLNHKTYKGLADAYFFKIYNCDHSLFWNTVNEMVNSDDEIVFILTHTQRFDKEMKEHLEKSSLNVRKCFWQLANSDIVVDKEEQEYV